MIINTKYTLFRLFQTEKILTVLKINQQKIFSAKFFLPTTCLYRNKFNLVYILTEKKKLIRALLWHNASCGEVTDFYRNLPVNLMELLRNFPVKLSFTQNKLALRNAGKITVELWSFTLTLSSFTHSIAIYIIS